MNNIIKKHIESLLKQFIGCSSQNRESYFQRIDEVFLLWSKIAKCSFTETCLYFGIRYNEFHYKNYDLVRRDIINKHKEYFEKLAEAY